MSQFTFIFVICFFLTSNLCINLCLIINNHNSDFVLSFAFQSETFINAMNMYSNLFFATQRHLLIPKMITNASQELSSFSSASLYPLDGKNILKCRTTRFKFSCIQLKHGTWLHCVLAANEEMKVLVLFKRLIGCRQIQTRHCLCCWDHLQTSVEKSFSRAYYSV